MRAPLGVLALGLWLSVPSAAAEESAGRIINAKNALVVAALGVRQARCNWEAAQGFLYQTELVIEIAEIQQEKAELLGVSAKTASRAVVAAHANWLRALGVLELKAAKLGREEQHLEEAEATRDEVSASASDTPGPKNERGSWLGLALAGAVWYGREVMPSEPTGTNGHILVVDDDRETCELVQELLQHQGFKVTVLTSASAALTRVLDEDFDAVLTDLGMEEMDGIALCERILAARPDLPVLVGTGQGSMETAIAAMRAGAYDFVTKPFDPKLLALSIGRGVQNHRLRDELKRLRQNITSLPTPGFIGRSAGMRRVNELVSRVASSDASVLIQGETGTGKELVARLIHSSSKRRSAPFVAINCAAVPHALLESELFGHARGAFTDARTERTGLFVEANGGTLFLDEIAELPLDIQPKLLRALQERTVRPVGSNAEQAFDARVLAATNRDLEYEVFEKRFRGDLFYRINVVTIELPPLRNRGGDVLEIAQYLLGRLGERAGKPPLVLSAGAAEKLVAYGWPGNVRELENCLERGAALARFDQLTAEDLPDKIRNYHAEKFIVAADDPTEVVTLQNLEKSYILRVLSLVGGNKSQAAQMLGVDRRTLYRKLARYENPAAGTEDPETDNA
jgi:two-component system response regulator HydG